MKLLFAIQLIWTAAVAAWPTFGSSISKEVSMQISAHLLRTCYMDCVQPTMCKRPIPKANQNKVPKTTVLLLNYTFIPVTNSHADFWITCGKDLTSNLKIILHNHQSTSGPPAVWFSSVRGCRSQPTIIYSTSNDEASKRQWTDDEVTAYVMFRMQSTQTVVLLAENEHQSMVNASSSVCPDVASSQVILRDSPLLLRRSLRQRSVVGKAIWVQINGFKEYTTWRNPIRFDLVLGILSLPETIFITTDGPKDMKLSIGVVSAPMMARKQVHVLSDRPLILDTGGHFSHSYRAMGLINSQDLNNKFASFHKEARKRLSIDMPPLGLDKPEILLRFGLSESFSSDFIDMPRSSDAGLKALVQHTDCQADGSMVIEVDAEMAKLVGLQRSQLMVNSPKCWFPAPKGAGRVHSWRLQFRAPDCGSDLRPNFMTGELVYENKLIVVKNGTPLLLKVLRCPKLFRIPVQPQKSSDFHRSLTTEPGQKLQLNYRSNTYHDFQILACGIEGGRFPIYTIFHERTSFDNELVYFHALPRWRPNLQQFTLYFKQSYPYHENPFKIFCIIEGCGKSETIKPPGIDQPVSCRSGEKIHRSKIILALVTVLWTSDEAGTKPPITKTVLLRDSIWISAIAFTLGVFIMAALLCIRHFTSSRRSLTSTRIHSRIGGRIQYSIESDYSSEN